jgi:hypothetical protein
MPATFAFPPGSNDQVELLVPFQFDPANPGSRGSHFLSVIGRLKPGVTTEQARSEMTSLMAGWKSEGRAQHLLNPQGHPGGNAGSSRRCCRCRSQSRLAYSWLL